MPAITIGEGRDDPQGRIAELLPPYTESLYQLLAGQAPRKEGWWSVHSWRSAYRTKANWESSIGVAVDCDYRADDSMPPSEVAARLASAARAGDLPGSIMHLTPHGARIVFVYGSPVTGRELQIAASKGAGAIVERALAALGLADSYRVDPCTWDLGRLFYLHNAEAKGVKRTDALVLMRTTPFDADPLAAEAPADPGPVAVAPIRRVLNATGSIQERIDRWVIDNSPTYPVKLSTCPVCGHNDCWKVMPGDSRRWFCFSTNHDGCGIQGPTGWHGDAMDLETHVTGLDRVGVLRRDGYLAVAAVTPLRPPVAAPVAPTRAWRQKSYLTCLDILRSNARDVLQGRKVELNELSGQIELGRVPAADVDVSKIRARIELLFVGSVDKDGNEKGMQQSVADIFAALEQVAKENGYNPVQQYLSGLRWDGVERIASVVEDILGAERTEINQAMVRRFLVSAVARAMRPGCKVDTVLVLVGGQGVGKSSFFRVLAGDAWFGDTAVDLHSKDSLQVLRGTWLYEWAELEALNRARDGEAAKAFLSSPVDRYRPSYGRLVVEVPRTCVIVGSTNKRQFLEDETGNRRFLPIVTGQVDVKMLAAQRDQLWAEAMAAYQTGEQWWLTEEQDRLLAASQEAHQDSDAWSDAVMALDYEANDYTTADVLRLALKKEIDKWSRADEMRIGKILRREGLEKQRPHRGGFVWKRAR